MSPTKRGYAGLMDAIEDGMVQEALGLVRADLAVVDGRRKDLLSAQAALESLLANPSLPVTPEDE